MVSNVMTVISKEAAKTLSKAKYWASGAMPDGLLIGGGILFAGTCALVAVGTKKYEKIKDPEDTKAEKIKKGVICYAPAGIVGSVSLGCFTGGHKILKKRNTGLVAAYMAVDEGFKKYREAVIEKYGEDEDFRLKNGLRVEKESVTEIGEDGKKHKVKKEVEYIDGEPNGYSFLFDDSHSMMAVTDAVTARDRLMAAQKYANKILESRGYITLNEVLRSIGLHETSAGAVVGWQIKGDGDGFIDFRMRQVRFARDEGGVAFLLDFNVDGPIYQDIDKYTRQWGE